MKPLAEHNDDTVELEAMIDRHGLYSVTATMAQICYGKADHLRANWQDREAAKRWDKAGAAFDRAYSRLIALQLD